MDQRSVGSRCLPVKRRTVVAGVAIDWCLGRICPAAWLCVVRCTRSVRTSVLVLPSGGLAGGYRRFGHDQWVDAHGLHDRLELVKVGCRSTRELAGVDDDPGGVDIQDVDIITLAWAVVPVSWSRRSQSWESWDGRSSARVPKRLSQGLRSTTDPETLSMTLPVTAAQARTCVPHRTPSATAKIEPTVATRS
jgi:hypothetical protein